MSITNQLLWFFVSWQRRKHSCLKSVSSGFIHLKAGISLDDINAVPLIDIGLGNPMNGRRKLSAGRPRKACGTCKTQKVLFREKYPPKSIYT